MAGLYASQGVDLGGGGSPSRKVEWHSMESGWSRKIVKQHLKIYKSQMCYINVLKWNEIGKILYISLRSQPYTWLPVFKITPAAGEDKVKIVHWNLLLPFGGNIEWVPKNEGHQHDVSGFQDCISAVSNDGVWGTEVVSTGPEPMDEGDAIHVQCVQTGKAKLLG